MIIEPDHYAVLELKPGSPMEEVKSQYRRLAKRWHPDLHGNDARSQERFRRINAAYIFLSDAPRKATYDACLQAARNVAASAPKPPPTRVSAMAASYHAPTAAKGSHARTPDEVRMTKSAWLGATAGAVLVLLVIGLSWDGSSPDRRMSAEAASPAAPGPASGPALGDGLEPGDSPSADSPAADPLSAPLDVPSAGASSASSRPAHLFSSPPRPVHAGTVGRLGAVPSFPVGSAWVPPGAEAESPADALKQRLLARYQAVLPRANRLINQGYAVRAAISGTRDGSRRILRDQLAVDLADLSAARARVRPALARLSRQDTPEELQQETRPVLADLRRLESSRQPVRDDLKALASAPATFRVAMPAPARSASALSASVVSSPSVPADPVPMVVPTSPKVPKPPDKPAAEPGGKSKPPASSGQEFIMWGK